MRFGWKVLLPVATLNAVVTALLVVWRGLMANPVVDTLKGFGVTFKQIFKKPITQQYPEYKRPVYPRFRGRHRLHRHENGLEKCVGCSLCAAACPADCIRVVAAENTPDDRVSAGERYARIYEINMSRCIFCGYCELACPFDAITLGNEFEISEYSRDDLIYTKDMLLAEPIKRVPVADRDDLRHADPVLQDPTPDASRPPPANVPQSGSSGSSPRGALPRLGRRRRHASRTRSTRALALIGNLGSLAVLYLLLSAEFVAAAQVLVYAGAVMVMFLFVIAYLGGRADDAVGRAARAGRPWRAVVAAGGAPRRDRRRDRPRGRRPPLERGPTSRLVRQPAPRSGALFLTDHLLAFEITSIVLLVAAVGGVVLGLPRARPTLERPRPSAEPPPGGRGLSGPGVSLVPRSSRRSCSRPARSACCSAAAR